MTERDRENLGLELIALLRAVVVGGPEFPNAGLIADDEAVVVDARWADARTVILTVRVRGEENAGRAIGKGGAVVDEILRPLARRVGARLGFRVAVEVVTA